MTHAMDMKPHRRSHLFTLRQALLATVFLFSAILPQNALSDGDCNTISQKSITLEEAWGNLHCTDLLQSPLQEKLCTQLVEAKNKGYCSVSLTINISRSSNLLYEIFLPRPFWNSLSRQMEKIEPDLWRAIREVQGSLIPSLFAEEEEKDVEEESSSSVYKESVHKLRDVFFSLNIAGKFVYQALKEILFFLSKATARVLPQSTLYKKRNFAGALTRMFLFPSWRPWLLYSLRIPLFLILLVFSLLKIPIPIFGLRTVDMCSVYGVAWRSEGFLLSS